jgi:hypothetical protein
MNRKYRIPSINISRIMADILLTIVTILLLIDYIIMVPYSHPSSSSPVKGAVLNMFRVISNSLQLSTTREGISCAANYELPSILWKPKVYYCFHKSLPLVPILSQTNPVHTISFYLHN